MRNFLIGRFLPVWAKETVLKENEALRRENAALKHRICEQQWYIRGMHNALRYSRRPKVDKKQADWEDSK